MKKARKTIFYMGIGFLIAFTVWTVSVRFVDVRAIGPQRSSVGFATLNGHVHNLIGVNMPLYTITDWLGLIPIGIALGFAILGLIQWIKRRRLSKVDYDLLLLGGFYTAVIAMYILFEIIAINYRPVLIEGRLEASYPSSTTMLVMCVMPTAIMQFSNRIKNRALRYCISVAITAFIAFTVAGRIISGVHWITDIIGGTLLSIGLVSIYCALSGLRLNQNYISKQKRTD